jgi:LPXTG-site transpeptidase (sortase) family protein
MSEVTPTIPVTIESANARRWSLRRVVRGFGWTFVWLGLFLLGFVAHQLFVTTWFAQQHNEQLEAEAIEYFAFAEVVESEFDAPRAPSPVDPEDTSPPPEDTSPPPEPAEPSEPPTLLVEQPPPDGKAFAIISVPTIDRLTEGWAVVSGVTRSDLKNGAGHMPGTALPGQPGNSVISGHRTTYGAPFHELDELSPGDRIEVETALGVHVYAVRETVIVRPTEIWVTQPRDGAWLTLTTCHPRFSARQRLVVFAELVDGPNVEAIYG